MLRMQERTSAAPSSGRSTSGKIMADDFPPSSSVTGRSSSPQAAAIFRPTGVEPVKAILSIPGWDTKAAPKSLSPVTMLTTPAGTPAAATASITNRSESGVDGAGLITVVHPANSAGASLMTTRLMGKFHGAISPHTPMGSFFTAEANPPAGAGRMSGSSMCGAKVAKYRKMLAALAAAPDVSATGEPFSEVLVSDSSWARASISSAIFSR